MSYTVFAWEQTAGSITTHIKLSLEQQFCYIMHITVPSLWETQMNVLGGGSHHRQINVAMNRKLLPLTLFLPLTFPHSLDLFDFCRFFHPTPTLKAEPFHRLEFTRILCY